MTALSLLASMNDMVVPSVRWKEKYLDAQSLPMDLWQVLRAKLSVQLLLTIVPLIVCEILFCICDAKSWDRNYSWFDSADCVCNLPYIVWIVSRIADAKSILDK